MSDRLDKAKAALDDAKRQHNDDHQKHLLAIARTQAAIAGAEALEELLEYTVRRWGTATFPKDVERYRPTATF